MAESQKILLQAPASRWSLRLQFWALGIVVITLVLAGYAVALQWSLASALAGASGKPLAETLWRHILETQQGSAVRYAALFWFLGTAILYFFTTRTRASLLKLTDIANQLVQGTEDIELTLAMDAGTGETTNEIQLINRALAKHQATLRQVRLQAEALSCGDLGNEALRQQVPGATGQALAEILEQIKDLRTMFQALAEGALSDPNLERPRARDLGVFLFPVIQKFRIHRSQLDALARGEIRNPLLDQLDSGEISQGIRGLVDSFRLIKRQTEAIERRDLTDVTLKRALPGELGSGLTKVYSTLENLVKVVQKTSVQLATSSRELAALAENLSQMSRAQAQATARTSTTFQELSVNASQVVTNVDQVQSASTLMVQGCQQTRERSRGTLEILNETVGVGEENLNRVRRLEESSKKIVGVTSIIGELANETRVLGVNAAIMAAQAGDNAGGFHVVAREIRRLSTKTVGATKEIKDYVLSIQKSIQDVVKSTSVVQDRSREGGDKAQEITSTMDELMGVSNQFASSAVNISNNIREQQRTIEDVLGAVRSLDEGAGSVSLTANEIYDLANHLKDSSEELKTYLVEFQV